MDTTASEPAAATGGAQATDTDTQPVAAPTAAHDASGPAGPAVTFGKRIGRNIYAAYERSLSGALGTLYVFYDLTRRVTVRAEAGSRAAVDLIFTFTFDGPGDKKAARTGS